MLVYTQGAAFEMDWWKFGGVSVDTTILHFSLHLHALHVLIWYTQKELERGVTTTAMAKATLRLKTLAFIPS